jgi:hypothetical protein
MVADDPGMASIVEAMSADLRISERAISGVELIAHSLLICGVQRAVALPLGSQRSPGYRDNSLSDVLASSRSAMWIPP